MRRTRMWPWLAGVLIPCAALALGGVRLLIEDARRADARYRARARVAADGVIDALAATSAALPDGAAAATTFVVDADGAPIAFAPAGPADAAPGSARPPDPERGAVEAAALDAALSAAARHESAGRLDAAAGELSAFVARAGAGGPRAAGLTALGALERKRGRLEQARAAWARLVGEHPRALDGSGLRRSFAARLFLIETTGSAASAGDQEPERATTLLLGLLTDVVAEHIDADQVAVGLFAARVRGRLVASIAAAEDAPFAAEDAAAAAALDALDRARSRRRRIAAAWRRHVERDPPPGAGDPPATIRLALRPEPGRPDDPPIAIVATVRARADGRREVGATTDGDLARAALGRPEVRSLVALGLVARLTLDGAPLATAGDGEGEEALPPEPLLAEPAPAPLEDVRLEVFGADHDAFVAAEARRMRLGIALAVAALLVASIAAVATVRGVNREVTAARGRQQFVAAVTHELKTPLASVRLLAELIDSDEIEPDRAREFARRIVGESDRLGRLVASVLELARLERGAAPVHRQDLAPAELARSVADGFAETARGRGFSVEVEADDDLPGVSGDRDALAGCVLNLLDNAMKYSTEPHAIQIAVRRVDGNGEGGEVHIEVADRGVGVPAGDADRLFEPFFRGGDELTRERPGVGLGLALVAEIAAAHGGRAAFDPRDGGGSRFRIELPATSAGPAPHDGTTTGDEA